ncbi:MAG: potassium channel family protein [Cyanophyceae cyanobacterium]
MNAPGKDPFIDDSSAQEFFLVCGLGSLGQHCVMTLKNFGVRVIAIELTPPQSWEIPDLDERLEEIIWGDCRQDRILKQAGVATCRAALLVTSNEQVNIETALAVRQLSFRTRLVVRSGQEKLNQLLSQQLGNFIAYEPTQLTSAAFALAALGTETLGSFKLAGKRWQVLELTVKRHHHWCVSRPLHDLNSHRRLILAHARQSFHSPQSFYQWEPDDIVSPGDTLVYLETTEQDGHGFGAARAAPFCSPTRPVRAPFRLDWERFKNQASRFWQDFHQPVRRLALICSVIVLSLLLIGTFLFHWYYSQFTVVSAFLVAAILLLGGYADLFGGLEQIASIPWWLKLLSFSLTVAGTIFVGVLYALLIEALLASRFQFAPPRPPIPQLNHVVIVGLGRVGQQVAALLQEFKQPFVGIPINSGPDGSTLPQMPLIEGNLTETLPKANLATAKSIVVVTNDEIQNLEVALLARAINPHLAVVIRTLSTRLAEHLSGLFPRAQGIGTYAVAAEAFAAAAFGENIRNLFRLHSRTILVTEYQIEAADTLTGLLLGEVAYGYGVVPILYQRPSQASILMPSDEIRLEASDRLVVLATIDGLRRIETGQLNQQSKGWRVHIETALTSEGVFEGGNLLVRFTGCRLSTARNLMNNLPQTLPVPLYKLQAQKLVKELSKALVKARILNS